MLLGSVRPRVRVPADVLVGVHDEDGCSVVLSRKEGERNQPSVVGLVFHLRVGRLIARRAASSEFGMAIAMAARETAAMATAGATTKKSLGDVDVNLSCVSTQITGTGGSG